MERWVSKLIAFFLIFSTMIISGLLPIKVADWFHRKGEKGLYYLSIISCFGGGVFFGAYLMHMAPEVRYILDTALLTPNNMIYPIPELMTGVGFFLLLYVDKIVMMMAQKDDTSTGGMDSTIVKKNENGGVELTFCTMKPANGHSGVNAHSGAHSSPKLIATSPKLSKSSQYTTFQNGSTNSVKEENGKVENSHEKNEKPTETNLNNGIALNAPDNGQNHNDDLAARPYIFLVALSIDCIFEGMSLGLQTTTYGVWILVIAILSHELVICFSFGLRILKLFPPKKVAILIVLYASTIPIGIAIGLIIFETAGNSDAVDIVGGFFQAISAGIFIYVSFFEILNEELTHESPISKIYAVTVGFLFMAIIVLVDLIDTGGDDGISGNMTTVAYN